MAADDYVRSKGIPFLAHLLRRLSDAMVADAGAFYVRSGITAPARTASTLLLLKDEGPQTVTGIAARLRQSHPLAITWIRQLRKLGFVTVATDEVDRRRTIVALTAAGEEEAVRMAEGLETLGRAYAAMLGPQAGQLFEALWRLEAEIGAGALKERLGTEPTTGRLSPSAAR